MPSLIDLDYYRVKDYIQKIPHLAIISGSVVENQVQVIWSVTGRTGCLVYSKNQMWLKYSRYLNLWSTWRQHLWLEIEIMSSLFIVEQWNLARGNNDVKMNIKMNSKLIMMLCHSLSVWYSRHGRYEFDCHLYQLLPMWPWTSYNSSESSHV